MSTAGDALEPAQARLQEIVAAYLQDVEAGRRPDQAELLARHPDLADELRSFFAGQEQLGRLAAPLRQPREPPAVQRTTDHAAAPTGDLVAGRYKLLEEIGQGGMGNVWMAEQREPVKRLVAVKLIKPGMDSR